MCIHALDNDASLYHLLFSQTLTMLSSVAFKTSAPQLQLFLLTLVISLNDGSQITHILMIIKHPASPLSWNKIIFLLLWTLTGFFNSPKICCIYCIVHHFRSYSGLHMCLASCNAYNVGFLSQVKLCLIPDTSFQHTKSKFIYHLSIAVKCRLNVRFVQWLSSNESSIRPSERGTTLI